MGDRKVGIDNRIHLQDLENEMYDNTSNINSQATPSTRSHHGDFDRSSLKRATSANANRWVQNETSLNNAPEKKPPPLATSGNIKNTNAETEQVKTTQKSSKNGKSWASDNSVASSGDSKEEDRLNFIQVAKKKRIAAKLVHVLAVSSLILMAYGLMSLHWVVPYYFSVAAPLLIIYRVIMYWKLKFQYFLVDFCYFANVLWYIFIWSFPEQEQVFGVLFAMANGPLLWGIPIYRNSLVFHDSDKVTSVFIHALPPFLSFGIRWFPNSVSTHWYRPFISEFSDVNLLWLLAVPLACFVFHSVMLIIVMNVIIKPSEEYEHSFSYLADKQTSLISKLINLFGPKFRVAMYLFFSWVYSCMSMLTAVLCYKWFEAHITFLALASLVATWNGATFYIDYFSVKGFKAEEH